MEHATKVYNHPNNDWTRDMHDDKLNEEVDPDHVVARTNRLFQILKIKTKPIPSYQELKNSATSMFVAIFECLFSVQLQEIERRPRVVTDYISNAHIVIAALSEVLQVELSPPLSAESIYQGDLLQIHHLLNIFEQLAKQLVPGQSSHDTFTDDFGTESKLQQEYDNVVEEEEEEEEEYDSDIPIRFGIPSSLDDFVTNDASISSISVADSASAPEVEMSGRNLPQTRHGKRPKSKQSRSKTPKPHKSPEGSRRPPSRRGATPGSKILQGGLDGLEQVLESENVDSVNKSSSQIKNDSLRIILDKYPQMYKLIARLEVRNKNSKTKEVSAIASRLRHDLARYKKSYEMLIRDYEAEQRRHALKVKTQARAAHSARVRQERVLKCRSSKLQDKLDDLGKSLNLRRQNRLEVLMKSLLEKSVSIQNECVQAKKRLVDDERKRKESEQLDKYVSIEQHYRDREDMLKESMILQEREKDLDSTACLITMKELEQSLQAEHESKLDQMMEHWKQQEDAALFEQEEELKKHFEELSDRFKKL